MPPAYFLVSAPAPQPGVRPAYMDFWTLFGTSNQLLAALTLLTITVWLRRERRRSWYAAIPAVFVMSITLWALFTQIRHATRTLAERGLSFGPVLFNGLVALALAALALAIVAEAVKVLVQERAVAPAPEG